MPSAPAQGEAVVPRPVPRAAWVLAIVADLVQLVAFPFFGQGLVSPLNDALDVLVSLVLLRMLGWHLVLLPALAAELVPIVNLAPTWTLSVAIVAFGRRGRAGAAPPPPPPSTPTGSRAEVVEEPPPALPPPDDRPRD